MGLINFDRVDDVWVSSFGCKSSPRSRMRWRRRDSVQLALPLADDACWKTDQCNSLRPGQIFKHRVILNVLRPT